MVGGDESGDGEIKICEACGETAFVFEEDSCIICPKCGEIISCFSNF